MQNKKYKVSYICNTLFIKWKTTVSAQDEDEACEIVSKKGKVFKITEELTDLNSKGE